MKKKYDPYEVMQEIDDVNFYLLSKEPFFAHIFSGLIKDTSERIPTACVSLDPESNFLSLLVNPTFWKEQLVGDSNKETREYRFGVIKHEILHIIFKHIFRVKDFGNKKLFNIAADIVVNQEIEPNQLIKGACTIDLFPDFNLQPKKGVDYYYKALQKEWEDIQNQEGDSSDGKKGDSSGNSGDSSQGDQRDNQEDENQSGGSNEKKDENQEKGEGQGGSGQQNDPNLNDSQNNLKNFMGNEDDHSEWEKALEELGPNQHLVEDKIEQQVREIAEKMQNDSKQWGNLPGYIKDFIKETLKPKKKVVNWKKILRRFAASSSKTYLKGTIRRPSKRYGTTPGIKLKKKQRLLVAIDTSGSVDNASLAEFFAEIFHIYKTGAEIRIVECDTRIGKIWDYKGKPPTEITGRGGTDFNAPFEYANEYKPDALIYFTDGYCNPPTVKSRVSKQMWIICKNGGIDLKAFKAYGFEGIHVKM